MSEATKLRWLDAYCHVCGERLNSWDSRISKTLEYTHLTCERCIAKEYDRTVDELRGTMEHYFGLIPCAGL